MDEKLYVFGRPIEGFSKEELIKVVAMLGRELDATRQAALSTIAVFRTYRSVRP